MEDTQVIDRLLPAREERQARQCFACHARQKGIALMVMLTLLTMWGLSLFVGQFSASQLSGIRIRVSAAALTEAKQALIGNTTSKQSLISAGYLDLPDFGKPAFGTITEGQASGTSSVKDLSVIGKIPWRTLGTIPLRDQHGECLWYAVSGRFKKTPPTDTLNWDTRGQIDVIDSNGVVIATDLAGLLIAPGAALGKQNRALGDPAYTQCGGNYDARNYLDVYDIADAISSEINYFGGSPDHNVAPDSSNKRFVMAANDHYNDSFLFITVDDIFIPLTKRSDFALAIGKLMNEGAFAAMIISGSKGTDNLNCKTTTIDETFCKNWREMLFLTQLPTPTVITIDGNPSANCNRVLFFSGRRATGQNRATPTQKADKTNYLEGTNASSFNTPLASGADFAGVSVFDWHSPENDLVRCLP